MKIKPEKRQLSDNQIIALQTPFNVVLNQFLEQGKIPFYKQRIWKINFFIAISVVATLATFHFINKDLKADYNSAQSPIYKVEKSVLPIHLFADIDNSDNQNYTAKPFFKENLKIPILSDDTIPQISDSVKCLKSNNLPESNDKGFEFWSKRKEGNEIVFSFMRFKNFSILQRTYSDKSKVNNSSNEINTSKLCNENIALVQDQNGYFGLLDSAGTEFVSPKYVVIDCFGKYLQNWALVQDKNGNYGFINSDGKEVVPTQYLTVDRFGKYLLNWALVQDKNGNFGFINSDGKEVVPTQYITIDKFGKYLLNWALVQDQNGNYGFINSDGKEVVPTQYLTIDKFGKYLENWALVQDNKGNYGFINSEGIEVVPTQYLTIDKFGKYLENWALVQDNKGNYGFINSEGIEVVPTQYLTFDKFGIYLSDWALVQDNRGNFGFVNSQGNEIVPTEYTSVYKFNQHILNYMVVEKNGLFGLISKNGKIKINPKYTSISELKLMNPD